VVWASAVPRLRMNARFGPAFDDAAHGQYAGHLVELGLTGVAALLTSIGAARGSAACDGLSFAAAAVIAGGWAWSFFGPWNCRRLNGMTFLMNGLNVGVVLSKLVERLKELDSGVSSGFALAALSLAALDFVVQIVLVVVDAVLPNRRAKTSWVAVRLRSCMRKKKPMKRRRSRSPRPARTAHRGGVATAREHDPRRHLGHSASGRSEQPPAHERHGSAPGGNVASIGRHSRQYSTPAVARTTSSRGVTSGARGRSLD